MNENKKKNGTDSPKWGRHPRESRKSHCVMVRFDDGEWLRFRAMHGKAGVEARAVFLKAHFFGQPFRVLVTDKTLLDYCTKLSAFHAQYRMVGNNYNQTVKELRCHFSEKKAMVSKGMALFGYVGIYIYELLKFKCSIRKANVNLVLVAIYCIFAQVICSMPVFALENWVSVDWVMLGINFLVLILSVVISKTGYFYKVSQGIDNYTMLSKIAAGICLISGVYLLVIYKMEEYLRRTDYIIFGIWTILIGVLIFSWQRERYEKIAKEKELELETLLSFGAAAEA